MVLARTTKLEAVNKALQMMGEAPLNSLQGLFGLGNLAETTINSVSRKVQTEGWSFNTDYQVSLVRDSITNHISVGDNVSRVVVDPYDYPDYDVVQRGQEPYDERIIPCLYRKYKSRLTIILIGMICRTCRVYVMTKTGGNYKSL